MSELLPCPFCNSCNIKKSGEFCWLIWCENRKIYKHTGITCITLDTIAGTSKGITEMKTTEVSEKKVKITLTKEMVKEILSGKKIELFSAQKGESITVENIKNNVINIKVNNE